MISPASSMLLSRLLKNLQAPEIKLAELLDVPFHINGDMSRRMYQVLAARVARVEYYYIYAMFLDMDTPKDAADLARELRDAVRRIAKIPTCVGIGPITTIALYGVALSTHFVQCLPTCIHEFLTHGSDWTDCGGAGRSRFPQAGVASLMRRMVCRLVLNSRASVDTPAPSSSRRATLLR
jgi:hypothetical protein